jgi:hypothetical protein
MGARFVESGEAAFFDESTTQPARRTSAEQRISEAMR